MLAFKAPEPNAVFVDIAPAPLPTRTPDRVASVVEVRSVNAPVLAVEAPTVVPFTVPPVIATVAAFCVEIVPRPKLVRDVIAEAKSDKLFARNAYVVSAPLAVTPKLVRASVALEAPVPPLATGSVAEIAGVIVVPSTYMERSAG